ncbi:hypothetical protein KEM56_000212 [Ascosphaera pollenicola]|nr:hypothetical protein KEM56_000212 [Ascosphaera pollenicola]
MVSRDLYKIGTASGPDFDLLPPIEYRAFSKDVSSQMCFNPVQELHDYRANDLRKLSADPRWQMLKVTSPEGKICGFSLGHFVPDPEEEAMEKRAQDEEKEKKKGTPEEEPDYPPGSNPEAYRAFFHGVIYRQRAMVAGQKRAVLALLAIDTEYQGLGLGTALLRRGAEIAESMNLPFIWLEATPAGHPVYKKLGFVNVDVCDFDWTPFGRNVMGRSTGMKRYLPMSDKAVTVA